MNEWVSLLQTFGLATMIIVFMGVCLWKASGWIAEKVIEPVVARYLQLLDALIASIVKQGDTLTRVGNVLEKLGNTLDSMGQHAVQSMGLLNQIATGVRGLQDIKHVNNVTVKEADHVDIHSSRKG